MSERELRELAARIQALEFVVENMLVERMRDQAGEDDPVQATTARLSAIRRGQEATMPHDVLRAVEHLWRRVIAKLSG